MKCFPRIVSLLDCYHCVSNDIQQTSLLKFILLCSNVNRMFSLQPQLLYLPSFGRDRSQLCPSRTVRQSKLSLSTAPSILHRGSLHNCFLDRIVKATNYTSIIEIRTITRLCFMKINGACLIRNIYPSVWTSICFVKTLRSQYSTNKNQATSFCTPYQWISIYFL